MKTLLAKVARRVASRLGVGPRGSDPASVNPFHEAYTTRRRFILTDLISAHLDPVSFAILDGGAREALDDPRWRVFDPGRVRLYGFEVDTRECEQLNEAAARAGLDYHYYPIGLWSGQTRLTLEENKSPGGSSFFRQNRRVTDRWKFENASDAFLAREIFYPVGTSEWDLTSVDAWAAEHEVDDLDFMKLNVQSAELEILKGGVGLLESVTGIMAEASFVESYEGRPFFADMDKFLRSHGFTFFDLIGHHCMGRARSPITAQHTPGLYPQVGQMVECHAVYFRDPLDGTSNEALSDSKILRLICFAEIFAQTEFAFELLSWIIERAELAEDAERAGVLRGIMNDALALYHEVLGAPVPVQG